MNNKSARSTVLLTNENKKYHIYKITAIVRVLALNFSPHDTYFVVWRINAYYYKYMIMLSIRIINNISKKISRKYHDMMYIFSSHIYLNIMVRLLVEVTLQNMVKKIVILLWLEIISIFQHASKAPSLHYDLILFFDSCSMMATPLVDWAFPLLPTLLMSIIDKPTVLTVRQLRKAFFANLSSNVFCLPSHHCLLIFLLMC